LRLARAIERDDAIKIIDTTGTREYLYTPHRALVLQGDVTDEDVLEPKRSVWTSSLP